MVIGFVILSGCIYIPQTRQFQTNGNLIPSHAVGKSAKDPIQLGVTHEADVILVVLDKIKAPPLNSGGPATGAPLRMTNWWFSLDGRYLAAPYKVRKGTTVWPLCFYSQPDGRDDLFVMEFDDQRILQKVFIIKNVSGGQVLHVDDKTTLVPTYQADWFHKIHPDTRRRLEAAGVLISVKEFDQRMADFRSQQEINQQRRMERRQQMQPSTTPTTLPTQP